MLNTPSPLVSVQVLTWNREQDTLIAIESIKNQTYKNMEIVLVDNGSSDNTVSLVRSKHPDIKIIELDKNYGCPGGRNRGIEHCSGEYIFYCDNDGILHPKAVENTVEILQKNSKVGIVTGEVIFFDDYKDIDFSITLSNENCINNLFQGGISCHRKSIYSLIGNYPDDYIYGGEETYLSLKLHETNYCIIKTKNVVLWHKSSNLINRNFNKVRGLQNTLVTAATLYPFFYFLVFFCFYILYYPFYFKRYGFPSYYFKTLLPVLRRVILALKSREPVSLGAYLKSRNNNNCSLIK